MFDPRKLKRYYTTEELGEALLWTAQQMSPDEKAIFRARLRRSLKMMPSPLPKWKIN